MRDGWRLAVGTCTVLPIGLPGVLDRRTAGWGMLLAPLAFLPVALVAVGVSWALAWLGAPEQIGGLVGVGVVLLGTRAIHVDGLADTVDGLGSGGDAERALSVMRRSDIGPMGVVTLIVTLGLQAVALGHLAGQGEWLLAAVTLAASRAALTLGTRQSVPAARPDGLGVAVAGSVDTLAAALQWLVVGIVLTIAGLADGRPWWAGVTITSAGFAAAQLMLAKCRQRLGGVTGDVLGCLVEVAATTMLVMAVTNPGT